MKASHSYRILVYCTDFIPQQSGYVHAFTQLMRNMANHGVKVDVVTPFDLTDGVEEFSHPNITVYRYHPKLNVWLLGLWYQTFQMGRYLKKLDMLHAYDMVLIETGDNPFLLNGLPHPLLTKTVVRFHSTSDTEYLVYSKQRKYQIKRWVWKILSAAKIKYVAATSAYHLQFVKDHLGFTSPQTSFHKLVNAIEHVSPIKEFAHANGRSFMMLGRMDEEGYIQKGYANLLQALTECAPLFKDSESIFTIIGSGSKWEEVRQYITNHKLFFVKLIQACSHEEVIGKLRESDIVVLPSKYEGVSMFALEALAEHNAVVFTQTGGLLDMLDDNGIGIEVGDTKALVEALKYMLLASEQELRQLKINSAELCKREFSPTKQWEQLEAILIKMKGY